MMVGIETRMKIKLCVTLTINALHSRHIRGLEGSLGVHWGWDQEFWGLVAGRSHQGRRGRDPGCGTRGGRLFLGAGGVTL